MKHIRCSIWGEIILSNLAMSIVDTPHFQHLHNIRQTGIAYKVFPGANTTRFEHSLGVYHVTCEVLDQLEKYSNIQVDARKKDLIAIIGLVHDLGHGAFSHLFDDWIHQTSSTIPHCHEERSCWLFHDLTSRYALDITKEEVQWICDRIVSPPREFWYDTLICNPYSSFDTDKMDYIIRDSVHFGLSHGINVNRILKNIRVIGNRIAFCDKIQDEIIRFFDQREKMYSTIYRSPKIVKFQKYLLQFAFSKQEAIHDIDTFLKVTDASILSNMDDEAFENFERRILPSEFQDLQISPFVDVQKQVAFRNTLFYDRKKPDCSFCVDLFKK